MSFASNSSVSKEEGRLAAELDRNINVNTDNIEAELKLLGEGEDEAGEAEIGCTDPPGQIQSDPLNGSSLILACSAANCKMSVPINNDSPDEAQEIVYQHQRTVHGYNDNQISAQIVDNYTDTLSKNSSTRIRPPQTTNFFLTLDSGRGS